MIKQRTIKNKIKATGVGVHTGNLVTFTLRPAAPNTGVVFRRVDLDEVVDIPASSDFIGETVLSTCLIKDGIRVSTVEHLMSAFAGLGIDNIYVDLDSDEVPIMDGSSAPFVFLIKAAGIQEQEVAKKFLKIKSPISVEVDDKSLLLTPFDGFKVNFRIDFNHPFFTNSNQYLSLNFSESSYTREVSRARTFGFLADFEQIKKNNLAKGSSLDNAVVFDEFKVMNKDGIRYPEEPLKHKILDVIGDLYLLGYPIIGELTANKSGHALNYQLLQAVLSNESAYEIVEFHDDQVDLFRGFYSPGYAGAVPST
jgi:UDP-3-O-[3-hydroxymyristoyl] N-acetylglucosamine deacetylase